MQAGKLRALGITTEQRWPHLPDVPTLSELGVRQKLLKAGAQPQSGPPQALSDHVKAEIDRWSKVVKASNAKID